MYLVRMTFNILKLHHKMQTGRLGNHLFVPGGGMAYKKEKQYTF